MIWKQQNTSPPFGVTPYFAALVGPEADDPIRRQFTPDPRETVPDPLCPDRPSGGKQVPDNSPAYSSV
ncbi:MAG: hypothetical protein LBS64_05995, partial [Spirochaetaceae bacterium]|nr:hypothetical protein [Spirochaetaceae bacterium]